MVPPCLWAARFLNSDPFPLTGVGIVGVREVLLVELTHTDCEYPFTCIATNPAIPNLHPDLMLKTAFDWKTAQAYHLLRSSFFGGTRP